MTLQEASTRLEHALCRDPSGRFLFPCKKAYVMVKLYGSKDRLRFGVRDKVVFRTDGNFLIIEKSDTGAVKQRFSWEQIECIAAGEPEMDNGTLFQG